jgi:hypothetical protein
MALLNFKHDRFSFFSTNAGLDSKYRFSKAYDILFYLIVLAAPVVTYGISVFGISLRLSRIFIVLISPLVLFKIKTIPKLVTRDRFLLCGILPYVAFTTLSILWTPAHATVFGINRLAALYEVIFTYIIFIVADLNIEKFKSVVKYYLASAIFPVGVGVWQIFNNMFRFSVSELPFPSYLIAGKYEIFKNHQTVLGGEGYSRISSCFAEPTIFGSFISSVLLLSFILEFKHKLTVALLRIFQVIAAVCIVLSLSKLALLAFITGVIIIFRKQKEKLIAIVLALTMSLVLSYFLINMNTKLDFVSRRLLTDSGHFKLLIKTFRDLKNINLLVGTGVGGIPELSTNKFLLSRIYEGGAMGLLFAIQVSILPFKFYDRTSSNFKINKIFNVCLGATCAVLVAFHLYDSFIYTWPWIIIGSAMSFYYNVEETLTT